ncbi:MAG: AAA family ATPase [Anaerolineae bacterium]|nr:AAA family ATPase [Anaerolineae bacterium]
MAQDIEQLKELIFQDNPLRIFDLVLQLNRNLDELTSSQQRDCKVLIMQSLLAVAERKIADGDNLEDETLTMLDDYRTLSRAKFVGVCLLRLVAEPNITWITNQTWRPKVAKFLDSQFTDTLYQEWKVEPSTMSHEKLAQISQNFQEAEKQFIQTIQALTSLDRLKNHRQTLMQTLKHRIKRVLFEPFLVDGIEAQLHELYTRVSDYLDKTNSLEVLDAYETAIDQISSFTEINKAWDTIYSQILTRDLGQKLLNLVKDDIANNNAAQPATVRVKPREKKYPLHQIGHEVSLGFVVTNDGPGYAYETKLTFIADDNVDLIRDEISLGRLVPGVSQLVDIPAKVKCSCKATDLILEISWQDFDGAKAPTQYVFQVEAQKSDVDWGKLARSDPYSLEPVIDEHELVGRKETLNGLLALVEAPRIGSAIIYGQKRVGKTSIAKALHSHLCKSNYLVVYLEGGDYVNPNPKLTISSLGRKLCTKLRSFDTKIRHLAPPEFEEALSPLTDYLDAVQEIDPDCRIVFILDEFDELPLGLYSRGPLGDSFFLTLRGISSRSNIGFILVGGEKMNHIIDSQGDQLNK